MLASLETRLSYQNFISGQEIYKDGQAKNGEEGKKQKYIKNLAMIFKKTSKFWPETAKSDNAVLGWGR